MEDVFADGRSCYGEKEFVDISDNEITDQHSPSTLYIKEDGEDTARVQGCVSDGKHHT